MSTTKNLLRLKMDNIKNGLQRSQKAKFCYQSLNDLEKKEYDSIMFADYEDRFQYFIALAILLLLIEFLIAERRSKILSSFKLFEK